MQHGSHCTTKLGHLGPGSHVARSLGDNNDHHGQINHVPESWDDPASKVSKKWSSVTLEIVEVGCRH